MREHDYANPVRPQLLNFCFHAACEEFAEEWHLGLVDYVRKVRQHENKLLLLPAARGPEDVGRYRYVCRKSESAGYALHTYRAHSRERFDRSRISVALARVVRRTDEYANRS